MIQQQVVNHFSWLKPLVTIHSVLLSLEIHGGTTVHLRQCPIIIGRKIRLLYTCTGRVVYNAHPVLMPVEELARAYTYMYMYVETFSLHRDAGLSAHVRCFSCI